MINIKINRFALLILSFFLILIFSIRFFNVFFNSEINSFFTSGYEEESLLILWYNYFNYDIYTNHLEYPYRWAIYNWLFYDFYSYTLKAINLVFNIDQKSSINFFRVITFIFSLIGFIFFYKSLKIIKKENNLWLLFLSILSIYGLSTGWWNLTTRPDIPALTLEIISIYFFLKNINNLSIFKIIILSTILYLAWSFKQTALISFFSILVFLGFNKEYSKCFFLFSVFFIFIFLTIYFQNDLYFQSIYMLNTNNLLYDTDINRIFRVLKIFTIKNIFLILLSIYLFLNFRFLNFRDNIFYLIGFLLSLIYFLAVLSNKGTSDNHTFIIIVFLTFIIHKNFDFKNILVYPRFIFFLLIVAQIFISGAVLFGKEGRLTPVKVGNIDDYIICSENILVNPVFVEKPYYALPWITKYENPTVKNFNYKFELEANRLKGGGFKSLIKEGFYETLILNKNSAYITSNYKVKKVCKDVVIYSLKKDS